MNTFTILITLLKKHLKSFLNSSIILDTSTANLISKLLRLLLSNVYFQVALLCFFSAPQVNALVTTNHVQVTPSNKVISERALTEQDIDAMLNKANNLRSSNNPVSKSLLDKLKKQAFLTVEQRHYLTYLTAIQLGFQGDYQQVEPLLLSLIESDASNTLKYRATYSLINLYTEQKRWRDGLKQVDTLSKIDFKITRYYKQLGLMTVIDFYIKLEQYDLAYQYSLQVLKDSISPRNICISKKLQLEVKLKSNSLLLKEADFFEGIDACKDINEAIFLGYIRLYQATKYLQGKLTNKALNAVQPYIEKINATNYNPLISSSYRLLAEVFWQKNQIAKAKKYAIKAKMLFKESSSLKDRKKVYKILFQAAQLEGNFHQALEYHKLYDAVNSELIITTQEKHLTFQLVQHKDIENNNKISLLNKTNIFLKTQHEIAQEKEQTIILIVMILVGLLTLGSSWVYNSWLTQQKLKQLANIDHLTGVNSRGHFFELANMLLKEQKIYQHPLSCIIFDLDHFKLLNDTYGHPFGDQVIQKVAKIMSDYVPKDAVLGRLGGEEFAIVSNELSWEKSCSLVEKIRTAIEQTDIQHDSGEDVQFTISAGLAKYHNALSSLDELLKQADEALYQAKGAGRNRSVFR